MRIIYLLAFFGWLGCGETKPQNCPSVEDLNSHLEDVKTYQVNSHEIHADWSHLWPEVDWDCFTSVKVMLNGTPAMTIQNDKKFAGLAVEPCQNFDLLLEVEMTNPDGGVALQVQSLPSLETKTFRPPSGNKNAPVRISVEFEIGDLRSVKVQGKLDDLVLDQGCHKVTDIEIVVEKAIDGEDFKEIYHSSVGVSDFSLVIRDKLLDLCASYNIVARLHGTNGTESEDIYLKRLNPRSQSHLLKAQESGFNYNVDVDIENLAVTGIGSNNASITWNKVKGCFDGFMVGIVEEGDESVIGTKQILSPDETQFELNNLSPCKRYEFSVEPFLGNVSSFGVIKPIFAGKSSTLTLTTNPDTKFPFVVNSKKYLTGKTSVTISVLVNEWPCLTGDKDPRLNIQIDMFEAKNDFKCIQSKNGVRPAQERSVLTFQGLQPCTKYKVRYQPLLKDDEKTEWKPFWDEIKTEPFLDVPKILFPKLITPNSLQISWQRNFCAQKYLVTFQLSNHRDELKKIWVSEDDKKSLKKKRETAVESESSGDFQLDSHVGLGGDMTLETAEGSGSSLQNKLGDDDGQTINVVDEYDDDIQGEKQNSKEDFNDNLLTPKGDDFAPTLEEPEMETKIDSQEVGTTIPDLIPCREYQINVQPFFDDAHKKEGNPVSTKIKTECEEGSGDKLTDTETLKKLIDDVKINQSLEKDGVRILISWKQEQFVETNFELISKENIIVEKKTMTTSEKQEDLVQFFIAPHCTSLDIKFTASSHDKTLEKMTLAQRIFTLHNPDEKFHLENFRTNLLPDKDVALSWDQKCVKEYFIRIISPTDKILQELNISTTSEETEIKAQVPASGFELCHTYSILIYPKNVAQNSSVWENGFVTNFTYVVPLNLSIFDVKPGIDKLDINWPDQPFSCEVSEVTVNLMTILNNSLVPSKTLKTTSVPVGQTTTTVQGLEPCSYYFMEVKSINQIGTLFSTKFRTLKSDGVFQPLRENEVSLQNKVSTGTVSLKWHDKCSDDGYIVEICHSKDESSTCKEQHINVSEESDFFQANLSVSSCSVYLYKIFAVENGDRTLIFNDSFVTPGTGDFNAGLEKNNFSVIQNALHFSISWNHIHPCISSYEVTSTAEHLETVIITPPSPHGKLLNTTLTANCPLLNTTLLTPCKFYNVTIQPKDKLNDQDSLMSTIKSIFFIGHSLTSADINVQNLSDSEAVFNWTRHLNCSYNYKIEIRKFDSNLALPLEKKDLSDSQEVIFQVSGLKSCTKYKMEVQIISLDNLTLFEPVMKEFTTTLPKDIVSLSQPQPGKVTFQVILNNRDCISLLSLNFCRKDLKKPCEEKGFDDTQSLNFDGLDEGEYYFYQVKGIDTINMETFSTAEIQFKSKSSLNITFRMDEIRNTSAQLVVVNVTNGVERKLDSKFAVDIICNSPNENFQPTDIVVNLTTSIVELRNLEPHTFYNCSGMITFDDSDGISSGIDFTTLDGIPGQPRDVQIVSVDQKQIELEWKQPEATRGLLLGYEVTVARQSERGFNETMCPSKISSRETTYSINDTKLLVDNLAPAFWYTVTVRARTRHSEVGNPSDLVTARTSNAQPTNIHIEKIKSNVINVGNITVEFSARCPTHGPTTFRAIWSCSTRRNSPKAQCSDSIETSQEVTRPGMISISKLPGGFFYDFVIEATVEDCQHEDCTKNSSSKSIYVPCGYQCRDGSCVNNKNARCNEDTECSDGSDEFACTCEAPKFFKCGNNHCIPSAFRCDGTRDCGDLSDEKNCPRCNQSTQFRCRTSKECISKQNVCDRKLDCWDGSDEVGCSYWKQRCWPEKYRCRDRTCISIADRCDGIWDCREGEDEASCDNSCHIDKYACRNRIECINTNQYCDGKKDCSDGSDELPECSCIKVGKYPCKSPEKTPQCISKKSVCNGKQDCLDGSDEMYCRTRNKTSHDGGILSDDPTIHLAKTYEKSLNKIKKDIFRPIDKTAEELNVRTSPIRQRVSAGSTAMVKCRDKSPKRAKVTWRRKRGSKIPTSAVQDSFGTLVIPSIEIQHSGAYVCRAKGYSKSRRSVALAFIEVYPEV